MRLFWMLQLSLFVFSCHSDKSKRESLANYTHYTDADTEIGIDGDSMVYCLMLGNDSTRIYGSNLNNRRLAYISAAGHYSNCFYLDGHLVTLVDSCDNMRYQTTLRAIDSLISFQKIERLYAGNLNKYLLIKTADQHDVYLIDWSNKAAHLVHEGVGDFRQVRYARDNTLACYVLEGKLYLLDCKKQQSRQIDTKLPSEIFNPSFYKDEIYFSSRDTADFTAIYKINYQRPGASAQLVLRDSAHDLRMPILHNDTLYHLQVMRSSYLLRQFDLKTDSIQYLTGNGVVYSYNIIGDNLVMVFSSERTSKMMITRKTWQDTIRYITHRPKMVDSSISMKTELRLTPDSGLINISADHEEDRNTIILYLHPGTHSDISPRYDPILAALAHLGYIIMAPNYPGSTGYGERFRSLPEDSAIAYLDRLKTNLRHRYPKKSIVLLSQSSGNRLAEKLLNTHPESIRAAASIFGVSADQPIAFKTPYLYLLSYSDPIVNWSERTDELKRYLAYNDYIYIVGYRNEGHWFRDPNRMEDAIHRIDEFYSKYP